MTVPKTLLSELTIKREWARLHGTGLPSWDYWVAICPLKEAYFTEEERSLSLDEFARRQGWKP